MFHGKTEHHYSSFIEFFKDIYMLGTIVEELIVL